MTDPQILAISHIDRPYANATQDPKGGRSAVGVPIGVIGKDSEFVNLKPFFDEYRHRPERRTGTVHLAPESFVDYVQRYYNKDTSVMFATPVWFKKYVVTVIFNSHPAGAEPTETGFGDFRAVTICKDYEPLAKALNMTAWVGEIGS